MFEVGQVIISQVKFQDGSKSLKKRLYIVVKSGKETVGILNCSSTDGKENKVGMPANYLLKNYRPPFKKSTFVKLDSFQEFYISELPFYKIVGKINEAELNYILDSYRKYTPQEFLDNIQHLN